jgi:hypothetical protein
VKSLSLELDLGPLRVWNFYASRVALADLGMAELAEREEMPDIPLPSRLRAEGEDGSGAVKPILGGRRLWNSWWTR